MAQFIGTAGKDTFTGTGESDIIQGLGGDDTLNGGDGYDFDVVAGGAGADTISSGTGSFSWLASGDVDLSAVSDGNKATSLDTGAERDTLIGGSGTDILCLGYGDSADGGASDDWVAISLMGAPTGVTYTLGANGPTPGGGNIANAENFVWLQGSKFGDTLYGGSERGFNTVLGMGGNDRIYAGYYTVLVDGGDGNDTIYLDRAIYSPVLHGGKGNDRIVGEGYNGSSAYGDEGDDTITTSQFASGGDGNDHVTITSGGFGAALGDAGDDLLENRNGGLGALIGGSGSDRLVGGEGAEDLVTGISDLAQRAVAVDEGTEHDTVEAGGGDDLIAAGIGDDVDGGTGNDSLRLSLAGAGTLTGKGVKVSTDGMLSGKAPILGGGTITGIEVLQFLGGTAFADSFDISASAVPQTLDAGGGDDVIVTHGLELKVLGGEGRDRLSGGNGAGSFDGGAGKDTASYATAKHGVTVEMVEELGGGFVSGVSQLARVEIVSGSRYADTVTGDNSDNVLGGMAGDDRLSGGGGNDTLDGGAGADQLSGGAGDDTYILSDALDTVTELAGDGTDTIRSSVGATLAANVENLVLAGAAATNGTGNDLGNVLTGNGAANTLLGLGGDDVLVGGAGQDTLDGGAGSDVYLLGRLADKTSAEIADSGTSGTDELRIAAAKGAYKALAGDTGIERIVAGTGSGTVADTSGIGAVAIDASALTGAIELIGNAGANRLTGTAFADQLDGRGGADTLIGGAGDDRLSGGDSNDVLSGDAGKDTLDGGLGADTMRGGLGDDSYIVDNTGDVVTETGGAGRDTVLASLDWTLSANVENLTLTGFAIEGRGNAGDNTITGNELGNVLAGGGGGKDTLIGGLGNDTYLVDGSNVTVVEKADSGFDREVFSTSGMIAANVEVGVAAGSGAVSITGGAGDEIIGGNEAANVLDGGNGNDTLSGHGGADTLRGGAGNDFLFGGFGADTLTGGAGSDQFAVGIYAPQGVDTITDFASGTDTLLVVNPYVSGYLLAGGLTFGTSAKDGDDVAIYDKASGNLYVDFDGNGAGAQVLLAKFTPGTTLAASDFVLITEASFSQQIAPIEQLLLI